MPKPLLFLLSIFFLNGCTTQKSNVLTIATAANMQFAMEALTKAFTQTTQISCQTVISSSGKLTAQIKGGAPYDVFVSADMKYPMELYQSDFTLDTPKVYAYGKLVLWTVAENIRPEIKALFYKEVHHIALANPKTAPYGRAAMEVLNSFQIAERLKEKLVYGESIAQTNQFILSGAADIGFISKSVVLSPQLKNKGNWIDISSGTYAPITQGVVVLRNNENHLTEARQFYKFLFSKKAQKILESHGYGTINFEF